MAERFEKLYSLPANLYSEGAPVIISAGSLLKDNETGKVIAQIKYHSISDIPIKALKIKVAAFDISGLELEGIDEYQYLDLDIRNGQDFGSNNPDNDESIYGFGCEPLDIFSYETAVHNSKLAKDIAEILKGDYPYGAPDFSPYTIAKDLTEGYTGLSAQFDEVWAMVYMMQSLGLIVAEDILDDEHGQVHYVMHINL